MAPGGPPLLQLDQVDASYGRRSVLTDVSLSVAPGEFVALLGPNGAGKSTLLKACFGLAGVTAGSVSFAGERFNDLRPAQRLARGLAFLPQGGQVFAPLSVGENLALACAFHPAAEAAPAPPPSLAGKLRQRAGSLSGGERQQLALAMALVGAPRLLLVDEPSIGLAPAAARAALESLALRCERDGLTVVLVEQNVALALEYAQRAVLLVSGRLVAQASCEQLRADEALRRQFTFGLESPAV